MCFGILSWTDVIMQLQLCILSNDKYGRDQRVQRALYIQETNVLMLCKILSNIHVYIDRIYKHQVLNI